MDEEEQKELKGLNEAADEERKKVKETSDGLIEKYIKIIIDLKNKLPDDAEDLRAVAGIGLGFFAGATVGAKYGAVLGLPAGPVGVAIGAAAGAAIGGSLTKLSSMTKARKQVQEERKMAEEERKLAEEKHKAREEERKQIEIEIEFNTKQLQACFKNANEIWDQIETLRRLPEPPEKSINILLELHASTIASAMSSQEGDVPKRILRKTQLGQEAPPTQAGTAPMSEKSEQERMADIEDLRKIAKKYQQETGAEPEIKHKVGGSYDN